MNNKYKLIKFTDKGFELDVRADYSKDTVWLTQDEMALLFDVDRTRIVRHINNIYKDKELEKQRTCAENAQVQIEGSRKVRRTINLYNLDMIISVGYQVKSQRGVLFPKEEMLWYINQTHKNRWSRRIVLEQFEKQAYQKIYLLCN